MAFPNLDERPSLPEPTGPYGVGQRVFRWTDDSRPEAMTDTRGDRRHIVVTLLYPTAKSAGGRVVDYFLDFSSLRKALQGPGGKLWGQVKGTAQDSAAPAHDVKRAPVFLFSPGNDMNAAQYATLTHELVSFGYVVAAIDHPYDSRAVLLPGGEIAKFAGSRWPRGGPGNAASNPAEAPFWKLYRARVQVRVEDALFALSRLKALAEQDAALSGLIDFVNAGFAGHSIGGVAAGQACRGGSVFRACLNLDGSTFDGPFFRDEGTAKSDAAYMVITKPFIPSDDKLREWGLTRNEWLAKYKQHQAGYFGEMGGGAYKLTVEQASHSSFSDDNLLVAIATKSPKAEVERSIAGHVRRYALAFYDQHLKSRSSVLAEATPSGLTLERW